MAHKIGHIPWNKGKTKVDFPQLSNSGSRKGCIPWNTGLKGIGRFGKRHTLAMQKHKFEDQLKNITDDCIEWRYGKHKRGYGLIKIDGKDLKIHRVIWALFNGEIPKGMVICHKCDNPSCFNPRHLFIGTQKDNMQDCKAKGRNPSYLGLINPWANWVRKSEVKETASDSNIK